MQFTLRVACAFAALFIVSNAFAFGPDGHRIVCHIALLELNAADRDEVVRLTRAYRRPDGRREGSFEQACNFADTARINAQKGVAGWEDFNEFENWHFLNVPRTTRVASPSHCHDDCVLEGLEQDSRLLREGNDDQARAEGLIFLGHWVADAHQPLHVSFRDDLGGNLIPLRSTSKYSGHLHRVWDSGIIGSAMRTMNIDDALEYASHLHGSITAAQRTDWLSATRERWLQESYDITLDPDVEYCAFRAMSGGGEKCRRIGGTRKLTQDYQDLFQDDVELRLRQAGVRLAAEIRNALHP